MRYLLCLVVLAIIGTRSATAQDHPVFFSDATSLARYAAMKSDYEANPSAPATVGGQVYRHIKTNADLTGTPAARYNDFGQWTAFMYHFSGDSAYAAKAWARVLPSFYRTTCDELGGNYIREYGWQYVLIYDFIYDAGTPENRTTFLDFINRMIACSTFRASDTDQTIGQYFAAAMWYQAVGSYNATAASHWNSTTFKFGGFSATGDDATTHRNAISYYFAHSSEGGEFLEGTSYNINTSHIFPAASALASAGVATFTDMFAWLEDAAISFIHLHTPGPPLTGLHRWGDIEDSSFQHYYRMETCLIFAGQTVGTTAGPYIQDFCLDYLSRSSFAGYDVYPRFALVFDGNATRGDYTTLSTARFNPGVGLFLTKTGWGAADSQFGVVMSQGPSFFDHIPYIWGEFQVWKNGKWAITHPITAGGPGNDSRGTNGVSIEGLSVVPTSAEGRQYRDIRAYRNDFTNRFHYITGTVGGAMFGSGEWNRPDLNLHEYTRSLLWLESLDSVVVYDRVNSSDLVTAGRTIDSALATWINSRPRTELYVHSPVSPTLGTGTIEWDYAAGEGTKVFNLLPANPTRTIEDEFVVWASIYQKGYWDSTDVDFHTRIVPASTQQWNVFLNVWNTHGSAAAVTSSLIQDTTNKVDATLVTNGATTVLAAFNAIQGPDLPALVRINGATYWPEGVPAILNTVRLRSSDFTLSWSSATATKALLFDLNPSATWTYTVNGGGAQSLTVDSNGIGVIDIAATGAITLAVTGEGGLPEPVVVETTTIPDCTVGVAYSQAITASGGDGGPYTCTLDSGSLPSGLSLNAACATGITGIPDAVSSNYSITKTASTAWGNSGAYSTNSLASGDGYVETTAADNTTYRMIGLSKGNTDTNYTDIDFGVDMMGSELGHTGQLRVYEGGVLKYQTANGYYVAGDVIRVAVVSGAIKYSKNGSVFYTSLTAPSYPLLVDSAFYTQGSSLRNVVGDFGSGAVDVEWTGIVGASVGGGTAAVFAVEVCDSLSACADPVSYSLNILTSPTVTTTSLPGGTVGSAYSETLTAVGGTEPFAWTVASGDLCAGLSLAEATGIISGTPTTRETCSFTVKVTDDAALTDEQYLSIAIAAARTTLTVSSNPGTTSVVIIYGTVEPGDTCLVRLLDGGTVLDSFTDSGAGPNRTASFDGLLPGIAYQYDVSCPSSELATGYFATNTPPLQGSVSWRYALKPQATLLARNVDNVSVAYNLVGEAADTQAASCASGCVLTLSLLSGQLYEIQHTWKTAGDAVVATSRKGTVAVP